MIRHEELGAGAFCRSRRLQLLIRWGYIALAGNRNLKIYGTLHCGSGKRMHLSNRVFFAHAAEAEAAGYRPCAHCLKAAYQQWKDERSETSAGTGKPAAL